MTRILTGVVGVLIMIPICFFSHTAVWPLLLTVFAFIAVAEMLSCLGLKKEKAFAIPAMLFALLPLICWLLSVYLEVSDAFRIIFLFSALFAFSEQMISIFTGNRLHSEKLYAIIGTVLYVVISLTAISQIRFIDHGNEEGKYIYLLVFFGAWISDTFAYFTGRAFGKHKLCPTISPKKTVEGSIGGIVANMIGFAGYAWVLRHFFEVSTNILFFAVLGALFSAVGQFGDLFASAIKRHYNVKDYGKLFPGHGGVLDRFDSTLAIALVMLMVYAAFGSRFLIG
jgi:phosphatidate cytidylyltransferase